MVLELPSSRVHQFPHFQEGRVKESKDSKVIYSSVTVECFIIYFTYYVVINYLVELHIKMLGK